MTTKRRADWWQPIGGPFGLGDPRGWTLDADGVCLTVLPSHGQWTWTAEREGATIAAGIAAGWPAAMTAATNWRAQMAGDRP